MLIVAATVGLRGANSGYNAFKLDKIDTRQDTLLAEVRELCDQATRNYTDLSALLVATTADLTAKVNSNATLLLAFESRLKRVEQT